MKADIHPKMHEVTVKFPGNHGTFKTISTYTGDTIYQDVYYENHPAWLLARTGNEFSGKQQTTGKKVERFKDKFGGFGSFLGNKAPAAEAKSDADE